MPPNTSDRERHLERQRRAWDLRQQGWSQRRIAADLGVDQGTVCRLLDRVYKRALAKLGERAARERAVQVDQLNHIVDELLQAWERSKKPAKRSGKKSAGNGDVVTIDVAERDGDPSYLASAMHAMAQIRELLGLNSREKEETSDASDLRSALLAAEHADAEYRPDYSSDGPDIPESAETIPSEIPPACSDASPPSP